MRFRKTSKLKIATLNLKNYKIISPKKSIKCPKCITKMITPSQQQSNFIGRCQYCGFIRYFIEPFPHQSLISECKNKVIVVLGAVNTVKTTASALTISKVMRRIPKVHVSAIAQTERQLEKTAKDALSKFFFKDEFKVFNKSTWTLKNGATITWIATQDAETLRGANVGIWWFNEASGISFDIYQQALTRLRDPALLKYAKDKDGNYILERDEKQKRSKIKIAQDDTQIIVESNVPTNADNWVRKLLMGSHTIIKTQSVRGMEKWVKQTNVFTDPVTGGPLDSVGILLATPDIPTVADTFLSTIRASATKDDSFLRELYCDLSFQDGLIYAIGDYTKNITNDLRIPEIISQKKVDGLRYYWMESIDPGGANKLNDETAYGLFIVDTADPRQLVNNVYTPSIYLIDGFKHSGKRTSDEAREISIIRNKYNFREDRSLLFTGDRLGNKIEKSSGSNFYKDLADYGIFISDIKYDINVLNGIRKVTDFLKADAFRLAMSDTHPLKIAFLKEWHKYRYLSEDELSYNQKTGKIIGTRVVDKDNHLMDMFRFALISLDNAMFERSPRDVMKKKQSRYYGDTSGPKEMPLIGGVFGDNFWIPD